MSKPNLFILGAPKCGTTSLASWLASHPRIMFSPIKEPHFFCTDYHIDRRLRASEYEKLFNAARTEHRWLGEASTGYLRSEVALPNILKYADEPRFLICIRNPVDMAISLHSQRVRDGKETETNFYKAWNLQNSRAEGKNIPLLCNDGKILQYGFICKLGEQIEAVYDLVRQEQVLILILEDIKHNPRQEYLKVLHFLDLPDDGRMNFTVLNESVDIPSFLSKLLRLGFILKRKLKVRKSFGFPELLARTVGKNPEREKLHPYVLEELRNYFKEDVDKLGKLIKRDLSHWTHYKQD